MDPILRLVNALRCLPGVGPKSAQRMVYHLLNAQRDRGLHLASCLQEAMVSVRHCERCNNHTASVLCAICANPQRDKHTLCIVESPADVYAIEQSQTFHGNYFVLMGKISPMDGIGPNDIHLPKLQSLIAQENFQEVILALSPTVEGQTTCHFICDILHDQSIKVSQLAHGIPSGGELEYLDGLTIGNALKNRFAFSEKD